MLMEFKINCLKGDSIYITYELKHYFRFNHRLSTATCMPAFHIMHENLKQTFPHHLTSMFTLEMLMFLKTYMLTYNKVERMRWLTDRYLFYIFIIIVKTIVFRKIFNIS